MNQITIKRAAGLAAALCMMFVFILGSLPVRAAGRLLSPEVKEKIRRKLKR